MAEYNESPDLFTAMLSRMDAIHAAIVAAQREQSELLDKEQVAALTNLGESTVDKFRAAGLFGPQDIRIGNALRWRRDEVLAWIANPGPDGELADAKTWRAIWVDLQRRAAKR